MTNSQNVIQFDPGSVFQSQSEQSGSEQDSAVESPVVDSVDSDSQQVLTHTAGGKRHRKNHDMWMLSFWLFSL